MHANQKPYSGLQAIALNLTSLGHTKFEISEHQWLKLIYMQIKENHKKLSWFGAV